MIRIVDYGRSIVIYYNNGSFDDVVAEIHTDRLTNEKAYEIACLIKKEIEEVE